MATILADPKNFKATQRAFLKQSLSDYSTFLNSIPLLVNYYSKDFVNSSHDVNLHTVHEILGAESPIKFNLIKDFPFYKASNLSADPDESDDVGTEAEVTGTCIVPPQNVQPREDDLFTIPWYGHKTAVFRVNKVERSHIRGRSFYQLSYYLYKVNADTELIDKQVKREYAVVGNPSSITKSSIVTVDKAELCFEIQQKIDRIVKDLNVFYDKRTDAYMIQQMGGHYLWWDECLHHFVSVSNTLSKSVPFRNELHPIKIDIEDYAELYELYKGTIFWAIENSNIFSMVPYAGAYMRGPFHEEVPGRHLRDVVVRGVGYTGDTDCCTACKFGYQRIWGNLWEYLRDESDTIEPDVPGAETYARLIKFWFNKPDLESVKSFLPLLAHRLDISQSIIDFYYLPVVVYILKDLISRIRTIYNFNN